MGSSNQSSFGQPVSQLGRSSSYAAKPFATGEHGRLIPEPASFHRPLSSGSAYAGGPTVPQHQVYVVRNDSQAAPVTIYHENGAQFVELPPRCAAGASTSRREEAHNVLSDVRSLSDSGSDAGRTATTDAATSLQEHRMRNMIKKPANGIYSGGPFT